MRALLTLAAVAALAVAAPALAAETAGADGVGAGHVGQRSQTGRPKNADGREFPTARRHGRAPGRHRRGDSGSPEGIRPKKISDRSAYGSARRLITAIARSGEYSVSSPFAYARSLQTAASSFRDGGRFFFSVAPNQVAKLSRGHRSRCGIATSRANLQRSRAPYGIGSFQEMRRLVLVAAFLISSAAFAADGDLDRSIEAIAKIGSAGSPASRPMERASRSSPIAAARRKSG